MHAVQLKCIVITRRMVADPHLALRAYDRHRAFMTLAFVPNLFGTPHPGLQPHARASLFIVII